MYAGAGSAPLMAAATAYANLAAEVSATATQWESIISLLTTEQWTGGGSAAAAAAAQPIVSYLTETASTLEQASAQATASAAAYEAAFAATVPPPVIAANRTLLATLVATNFLGVNSAAIAATEAQYAEMWVQDATMMATYQAGSAAAGVLTPVTPLTSTTDPAAAAAVDNSAVAFDAVNGTTQATGLNLSSLTSGGGLLEAIDHLEGTRRSSTPPTAQSTPRPGGSAPRSRTRCRWGTPSGRSRRFRSRWPTRLPRRPARPPSPRHHGGLGVGRRHVGGAG